MTILIEQLYLKPMLRDIQNNQPSPEVYQEEIRAVKSKLASEYKVLNTARVVTYKTPNGDTRGYICGATVTVKGEGTKRYTFSILFNIDLNSKPLIKRIEEVVSSCNYKKAAKEWDASEE